MLGTYNRRRYPSAMRYGGIGSIGSSPFGALIMAEEYQTKDSDKKIEKKVTYGYTPSRRS